MTYEPGQHTYSVTGDLHNADIGAFCSIAGGLTIHDDDNHAWVYERKLVSTYPFSERWNIADYPKSGFLNKRSKIGNDVWICLSVSILPGVTIGDGAIIGAHSVVTKDVPPYAIVSGNPAQIKGYRFAEKQIAALLKIKWWEWQENTIRQRINDFRDIDTFIKKYS